MYRNRGYLPHLELAEFTYFVTFRLAGTLPQSMLRAIQEERLQLKEIRKQNRTPNPEGQRLKYLETRRIQDYLDKGIGDCWLKEERIAEIVVEAIRYFEGVRYISHAWCMMPNHLHWVLTPQNRNGVEKFDSSLSAIMHGLKSFTAHQANKILKRSGPFWSREYYDHCIRDAEQFARLVIYTIENPVKAGLCTNWQD